MQRFEITFHPRARADLFDIHDYIAAQAGFAVASGFVKRIEAACQALETFPHRGTRRDDIIPGLRVIGFERRATIVFQVKKTEVDIVRIFYGGQDYDRALRLH